MATRGNWFVICGYALVAAATQLLWLTYAPITTDAAAYYEVSEGAIGALSIIFPLIYVVLAIPAGLCLDRWFRPALVCGALLTGIGGVVRLAGESSFVTATVGQVIVSIGQPLVLGAITVLCVKYLPPDKRATGIAVGSAALFAGMLIAFVTGALWESDISTLLIVQGGFALIAAIALCVGLVKAGQFGDSTEITESERTAERDRPLRAIWADPIIRLLILVVAVGFGVFVTITTWLQVFLEPAGVSTETASFMLLVMVVAGIIGAAFLPPVAARYRNQPNWLFLAIAVSAIGCVALAALPGAAVGVIVSALFGFFLLATLPIVLEMVEQRTGPAASTATSLVWLAGNAGGVLLSVIVGFFVDSPTIGFLLTALVALCVGVPLVWMLRQRLSGMP